MNMMRTAQRSQIKSEADEEYNLNEETGNFSYTVFGNQREQMKNEGFYYTLAVVCNILFVLLP